MSKRQRTVYPTRELCHLWAHGSSIDLRNSGGSVFTYGNTIYSYGTHFPMSRRLIVDSQVVFLINPDSYSNTTSGHQSHVRQAIPNGTLSINIDVGLWDQVKKGSSGKGLREYFRLRIKSALSDAHNTRMGYWRRADALSRANRLHGEYKHLHSIFRFRTRKPLDQIPIVDLTESKQKYDEREAIKAEKNKAQSEEWARQNALTLQEKEQEFRDGKQIGYAPFPNPLLRIKGDHVETTMGARVKIEDARRFLKLLPTLSTGHHVDIQIGPYRGVNLGEKTLSIGCHHFTLSEVLRLKKAI